MLIRPQQRITPGRERFVRLMDFYEQNYLYLRKLVPNLEKIQEKAVSVRRNSLDLHLQILEKEKFTTTILLTYYFKGPKKGSAAPELIVRIYHDAKNVEVLSAQLQGKKFQLSQSQVDVKQRYQLNRFLFKWLRYLLGQGHLVREPFTRNSNFP